MTGGVEHFRPRYDAMLLLRYYCAATACAEGDLICESQPKLPSEGLRLSSQGLGSAGHPSMKFLCEIRP